MTREEDLIRIAKKLDKMVSRNNTEGSLDLLKELKNFNMTLKLLQETRIGMSVNGIRKHCTDEDVVALAKILIKDWKRLLDSAHSPDEKANEMMNGIESCSVGSAKPSLSEKETRLFYDQSRKESSDSMLCFVKSTDHKKKERSGIGIFLSRIKHSTDGKTSEDKVVEGKTSDDKVSHGTVLERKVTKNLLVEVKKERKESTDSKPPLKRSSLDGKKNKDRKDSSDSKPAHPTKRPSSDSKSDRRESTDSKTSSSPLAKKLTGERRESQGSKSTHTGTPQRKSSTDSIERRGKADTPKSPTTPTSPMSPSFSSAGGPLSPRLATGDSIRDKCIEMLTAALRTDDNYKEFGTNCDSMAAELEDYILYEFKATDMKYKNKVRSRISNLKDPKNPGLRRNILAGGLELSRFANMTSEEMASDELKQLRNDLTQEAIREHQMAKTSGTTTDMLQCSKCRKKNCSYNQVQTRSADEPMTTFVLCNECGNRWKFC
ncbi:transcription elongation factor A protein 3 [Aplochiton taeniatus]